MFKGLFDTQSRLAKIDKNGDPLKTINDAMDWSIFNHDLAPLNAKPGGRPGYDVLLKFKMLVIQSLYNLSDEALEQQVLDRLSFMRFLGLGIGDNVPDAKTIWVFREELKKRGLVEKLFDRFGSFLIEKGFHAQKGQIVDASIVKTRVRRDSKENNDKIKNGEEVTDWKLATRAQKDTDASWTLKNHQKHFGYKNHICPDVRYKLIRSYDVTTASKHDSNVFESLLTTNKDPSVYADSAYYSKARVKELPVAGYMPCLNEKSYRYVKLDEAAIKANHERSRIRVLVEHVFGQQVQRAGNLILRTMGLARARVKIGLRNLAYNIERYSRLATQS